VEPQGDELGAAIAARIQYLNDTRGWPWMQPGVISVALDEQGRTTRYLATEAGLVPLGPASPGA
jgi:hypothetical protein